MSSRRKLGDVRVQNAQKLGRGEGRATLIADLRVTWKAEGERTGYQLPMDEVTPKPRFGVSLYRHPFALAVSRRYAPIVFGFIMSAIVCAVTSSMITAINTGLTGNYVLRWVRAYALAWSFAFPTVTIFGPRIRCFVEHVTV